MHLNIAIDGPSGAGKSTIAKMISESKKITYLDTGAMYRAFGYYVLKNNVSTDDVDGILKLLPNITMAITYVGNVQHVFVCGEDVTPYIRQHNISMAASTVSKIPEVRIKLVELQREIAENSDCVLDGRDIGTYVLPNAKYKFFLTANAEIRAKRRYDELILKGEKVDFDTILKDVLARDEQDKNRDFAPLKQADDAILIDSTNMTIDEVVAKINKYL